MKILPVSLIVLTFLLQGKLAFAADDNANCSNRELHNKFQNLEKIDQDIRYEYMSATGSYGDENPQAKKARLAEIVKKLNAIDKANQDELAGILNTCGWPTTTEFKNSNLAAAFVIIVHAPLEYQERYFPLLKESFSRGEIPEDIFSKLTDRMELHRKFKAIDQAKAAL